MENSNKRTNLKRSIRLGMYGDASMWMLAAVKRASEFHPGFSTVCKRSFKACELSRATDNEIVLDIYADSYDFSLYYTAFKLDRSDAAVRKWLAKTVKGFAKMMLVHGGRYSSGFNLHTCEITACDGWDRKSDRTVSTVIPNSAQWTFSVAQLYALYDVLAGHAVRESQFPPNVLDSVLGRRFDPVRTELEEYRREEEKRIREEELAEIKKANAWYDSEKDNIYAQLKIKQEDIRRLCRQKLDELNRSIAEGQVA